jgi:AcrR family transcriptional regulator
LRVSTVSEQPTRRAHWPTDRGRRTQAAIDAAARTVVARKGIPATTIADIAAEADRSTASFRNCYDSTEAMVREWALRFRDEADQFCYLQLAGTGPRLAGPPDDQTRIDTLAYIFYRAVYYEEVRPR